jgi:hypothetical protein
MPAEAFRPSRFGFIEQVFCGAQVLGLEPLREHAEDWGKMAVGFLMAILLNQQLRKVKGSPQFPEQGPLKLGKLYGTS